jgi:hypothetical protein
MAFKSIDSFNGLDFCAGVFRQRFPVLQLEHLNIGLDTAKGCFEIMGRPEHQEVLFTVCRDQQLIGCRQFSIALAYRLREG